MTRRLRPAFLAFILPLLAAARVLHAQDSTRADAEKDPVLRAMLAELARNQAGLVLKDAAKPYFLEFRLEDVTQFHATASFGALTGAQDSHARFAHIRVHVGSYKLDNSQIHLTGQYAAMLSRVGIGGDGTVVVEVVDNDPVALRYSLWAGADAAYKQALENLAKREQELKSVQQPPQCDDFSTEKPTINLEPVQHLDLDRAAWTSAIVDGSGLAFHDPAARAFAPELEEGNGAFEGTVRTQYLVNSEGTIVRKSRAEYRVESAFGAQAADGMPLVRSVPVRSATAEGLGTPAHFVAASLDALKGVDALHSAPLVTEEYHGPVLLEASASARLFDAVFARAVEARPPGPGSSARVTGAFSSSFGTRVLPDFLTVTDDPSTASFNGKEIAGAYAVDDEGVPAQKVLLVDKGKLVGFDIGREPVRDLPSSNGHGRAGIREAPIARVGVLRVDASNGLSEDDLRQKLISLGKDQGLPFVYIVRVLGEPDEPRVLERVDVVTGKRQLVRGAELGDLDLRSLRGGVLAAGNTPAVYNTNGESTATVIAPALLFDNITVKRSSQENAHLPYIPIPAE